MSEVDGELCFRCRKPGHFARSCPDLATDFSPTGQEQTTRPPWCGGCDPRTRLIDHGAYMERCSRCWAWPARGTHPGQLLPQHKRCGGCQQVVYAWDAAPCGKHQSLGGREYAERPARPSRPEQRELALQQVAESRRLRLAEHDGDLMGDRSAQNGHNPELSMDILSYRPISSQYPSH
jgi:hypothetical protein